MEELIEALSIRNNPKMKEVGVDLDLITIEDLLEFWNSSFFSEQIKQELTEFLNEQNLFSSFSDGGFYKGKDKEKREHILLGPEIVQELKSHFLTNFDEDLPKVAYSVKYGSVEAIQVDTNQKIEAVKQAIRKNNVKVTKRLESLAKAKKSLELAKAIVAGRRPEPMICSNTKPLPHIISSQEDTIYLFAVDVESFEKNHSIILELGWIIFDVLNQRFYNRHIIIKEYQHVRNYKYVPDCKDKFMFGKSEFLSEEEAKRVLQNEIDTLAPNLAMICHGLSSELKYFQKMGLRLRHTYEFDTNELHHSLFNDHGKSISLVNLLNKYNIESQNLHNAGNDAHYTLLAFLAMCGYSLPAPGANKNQDTEIQSP